MMWKEFEEIAGYEVSYETYTNVIEPMYMATSMSKQDFVKCLDKKAFALPSEKELVKKMRKIANFLFENCGRSSFIDEKEELENIANAFAKRFYDIDRSNTNHWYGFESEYAYCGTVLDRGCSFPKELVIGKNDRELARIRLVKC